MEVPRVELDFVPDNKEQLDELWSWARKVHRDKGWSPGQPFSPYWVCRTDKPGAPPRLRMKAAGGKQCKFVFEDMIIYFIHYADGDHPDYPQCGDSECFTCGTRDCPSQQPDHYHHDGCPACDEILSNSTE